MIIWYNRVPHLKILKTARNPSCDPKEKIQAIGDVEERESHGNWGHPIKKHPGHRRPTSPTSPKCILNPRDVLHDEPTTMSYVLLRSDACYFKAIIVASLTFLSMSFSISNCTVFHPSFPFLSPKSSKSSQQLQLFLFHVVKGGLGAASRRKIEIDGPSKVPAGAGILQSLQLHLNSSSKHDELHVLEDPTCVWPDFSCYLDSRSVFFHHVKWILFDLFDSFGKHIAMLP